MHMPPRNILVTGGAGFLGSHLCQKLLEQGNTLYCLDNLSTGHIENIEHLLSRSCFSFVKQDVNQDLTSLFEPNQLDEIYHLACPASPIKYQQQPINTIVTSVQGTLNVLNLAQAQQAKLLHASTSEVYGDPLVHPQPESYYGNVNPVGPRACYDEGKRCAESLVTDFHRQFGTSVKIVRIFNTYGPRMHPKDGRVISNFIMQALRQKELTIYGLGHQTRCFCYVDDLVKGLIDYMNEKSNDPSPVNIGSSDEISIKQLAKIIVRLTNASSNIKIQPKAVDDPSRRCPQLGLAQQLFAWNPQTSLEEGLLKTIEYFKNFI